MASPVPVLTFDLWHTLLYLEPEDEDTYNRHQTELGVQALEEAPLVGVGSLSPTDAFQTASREAVERSQHGESVSLAAQIQRAATLAGRRVDPARYVESLERLVASSPFRVAPGALNTMAAVSGRGTRIGVVANTVGEPGRALHRICEREGFGQYVRAWCWSDELPWTKPSPEIFLHCLNQLGGVPARAVHVGDASWDIEGAQAAGFRASVLYTGLARYGAYYRTIVLHSDPAALHPDYTISRLDELPAIVGKALGTGGDSR